MNDVTLESLATRVAALELAINGSNKSSRNKDWRGSLGMFRGSEVMRQVDAEGRAIREAERELARREDATP